MSDTLHAEFLAWMAERDRREREQGEWWLTPEGRKSIRETWDSPIELDAPPVLLTALEAAEARIAQLAAKADALRRALEQIAAIEDLLVGQDWEEIEQARSIARAALASASPPTQDSGEPT